MATSADSLVTINSNISNLPKPASAPETGLPESMRAVMRMRHSMTTDQILKSLTSRTVHSIHLTKLRDRDINVNNIKKILDALEKALKMDNHIVSLSVSATQLFNPELKKRLLDIVKKGSSLKALALYEIPVTLEDIKKFVELRLIHLTLDSCQVSEEMSMVLAESETLQRLILTSGRSSSTGNHISVEALIAIFRANRIQFLALPNAKAIDMDKKVESDLIQAYEENTSIRNPFFFRSSILGEDRTQKMEERRWEYRKKRSQDKTVVTDVQVFKYEINFKGQKIIKNYGESSLREKMDDIIKSQSGLDLATSLKKLNFDPNCFSSVDNDNPFINMLIANELYEDAWKIITAFPGQIDLTKKDMEGKTALIIAAKIASPRKSNLAVVMANKPPTTSSGTFPAVTNSTTLGPSVLSDVALSNAKTCENEIAEPKTASDVFLAMLNSKNDLDLDAQDDRGCTALHYLAANRQAEFFRWTVEAGASVNIRDNEERTPLDYCTHLLDREEQRAILFSIVIDPDRDIGAIGNAIMANIPFPIPYISDFGCPTATLASLEALRTQISDNQNMDSASTDFLANYQKIRDRFTGMSIVEACQHPDLIAHTTAAIMRCGGLSFLQEITEDSPLARSFKAQGEALQALIQSTTSFDKTVTSIILQFSGVPQNACQKPAMATATAISCLDKHY